MQPSQKLTLFAFFMVVVLFAGCAGPPESATTSAPPQIDRVLVLKAQRELRLIADFEHSTTGTGIEDRAVGLRLAVEF